ncbi:MAG: exodeoxyribonuclease III [Legionellales bacterium]|nr:exodeoxyribonuclease III [Legionellales bacterium]
MSLTIATWNVNSIKVRLPHVIDWLQTNSVDVLALQEIKCVSEQFPETIFQEMGYHVMVSGQKTYNGVAILAKSSPQDIITALPDFTDEAKRVLAVTINDVRILNLYVPNGASVDSDKYHYKLAWLAALKKFTQQQLQEYPKIILLGDFNIAPDDRDVHDPKLWEGHVLVSAREREALQQLLQLGLHDCYRLLHPETTEFSWWDYRQAAFRRNLGLRIDHILCSEALKTVLQECRIDPTPRKLERPSDHAPVIAEFLL